MFRQLLYVQWKWARLELMLYSLAAFLIPTLIIRLGVSTLRVYSVENVLGVSEVAGAFYVLLAIVCATGLAVRPWLADASLRHVYALSLPVPWPSFVRSRFLAGAALLVFPVLATWIGGVVATAAVSMPPTLHSYPGGVALRFGMSALVAYGAVFVLQYSAGHRAARIAVAAVVLLLTAELSGRALGYGSVSVGLWHVLTTTPGPFETLTARWMLIDV